MLQPIEEPHRRADCPERAGPGASFRSNRTPKDRPDRLLKTREFVVLLEFYLDRAMRYRLFDPDAAEEAGTPHSHGYQLQFTRSALIFDFEKPGTEPAMNEGGIEYHRVGKDLIYQLLEAAKAITRVSEGEAVTVSPERANARGRSLTRNSPFLACKTAAFLGTPRVRQRPVQHRCPRRKCRYGLSHPALRLMLLALTENLKQPRRMC